MRAAALGLVLGVAIGCGGTSGLESFGIFKELIAKGMTAGKEADEKMKQDRPDAAYYIMRRHVNEVDDAIAKVENDRLISERDKAKTIEALREYQGSFKKYAERLRAYMNLQSELGGR